MNESNEQTPLHKLSKDRLKTIALTQRIGEITSKYEDELADLRAGFTQQLGTLQDHLKDQEGQIEALQEQLRKTNESIQQNKDNQKSAK
jgi:predicted  nucleic acid-binding Zn-ribbon protein